MKLVLVKRVPDNHIDELNLRLQQINGHNPLETVRYADVNPSIGDLSDRESEFNVHHLESNVSSLSGIASGSSVLHSPEIRRNQQTSDKQTINVTSIETDF